MSSLIIAKNLKKVFKNQTEALRDIDLSVEPGEILAIMGPSGSGKSTLLHCLAGIIKPTSGQVIFNNQEISKWSDKKRNQLRREQFGFVFQFSQLVPELTALDNIALPLLINKVPKKQAYLEAKRWLNKVGVEKYADHLSGQLSGGQAQRIAVARSMIHQPKVIFADEPTGSLDTLNSERVMNLFLEIAKKYGTTVVMVTHEPSIAAYADREIIVRDGKVVGASHA